ncbi:hypothetical protein A3D81_00400 [Candidatus Curtissbacteria bacterium RIFCSPHIGHO2_02_FULL_40_17]|uniref:Toxin n=4 Tax=Microgenomates group TaxID=1794810 RepID=A0A1F7K1W2_9BACT|nr:MAG: hypothetical protein A3D81_00400 [Candidatus Curtissbacteria bacterium RIFCSPHIGHO2_02_FULL_40_17]OGK37588.1 MAG: hypothetical protein A3F32_01035 [Candidatus Roizmanbacteria bacterium RIFCSPHIGHO2_12_FULL_42_10]OGK51632.1 MAG: hypothetical protein A3B02_00660 [Candidatus Roizmanbacteria bacterium RIFCSPLOWO2_01_FULL_42_14]OGK61817.1 MAG: hypothetical protein A3I56_04185 [Candidatus Roizmanbacteria bacterium RIFCSPLOWO2_02_FULL_43_10]
MGLPVPLSFDWDNENIDKNWKKHQVHYKEAEEVFYNRPIRIYRNIVHSLTEKRFSVLGITDSKRLLYISFPIRGGYLRVISARDQSKKERSIYAKK